LLHHFFLSQGEFIPGFDAGSCVIPPDAVLLFDVEFVSKA